MHSSVHILFACLATTAIAKPLEARSGLVKRMFWCNGLDSHTICAPGQRMVPMEEASCQVLRDAGRLNDVSPAAPGERSVDCGHDDSAASGGSSNGGGGASSTTSSAPASTSTTAAAANVPPFPAGGNSTTGGSDGGTTGGTSGGEMGGTTGGSTGGSTEGTSGGTTAGTTGGTAGGSAGGSTGGTKADHTGQGRQFVPMICEKIDGVIGQWESLNCTMFNGADGGQ